MIGGLGMDNLQEVNALNRTYDSIFHEIFPKRNIKDNPVGF